MRRSLLVLVVASAAAVAVACADATSPSDAASMPGDYLLADSTVADFRGTLTWVPAGGGTLVMNADSTYSLALPSSGVIAGTWHRDCDPGQTCTDVVLKGPPANELWTLDLAVKYREQNPTFPIPNNAGLIVDVWSGSATRLYAFTRR